MTLSNTQHAKKRILYVITKSNWGGAQRYVYDLATGLPKDHFAISVACGGQGLLKDKLEIAGIKIIPIPYFQRDINITKEFYSFVELIKIFRTEKPDIIHLNSSKAGVIGALAAFVYKLITNTHKPKIIYTVHGWAFKEDRSWFGNFLIFLSSWFSSFFQDKIIVINSADLILAKKFMNKKKIIPIPNGIKPPDFLSREDALKTLQEKTGIEFKNGDILIGTIAELTKNKGLVYFIESIRILKQEKNNKEFRAIIIGEGQERSKLENLIRKYNLTDTIKITGFITEAAALLKAFDIFIMSSVKEGLPYTLMEAMSAELPIVATEVGGIPDLIENGKNGFLTKPKDPENMSKKIMEIMYNREVAKKLGTEALDKINKDFKLSKMLNLTGNLYHDYD